MNVAYLEYRMERCDEDEDIITDPALVTKYINKMRVFYLLKMTSLREKYEKKIEDQKQEITKYMDLHKTLSKNKQEESLVKKELVQVHNHLKDQESRNKNLLNELEVFA